MAGRAKADCGANSMEHSYALTHLIPIGLRAIGCHLGSGVNGFAYCVLYDTYKRRGEVAVRGDGWRAGCLRVASSETTQITSSYPMEGAPWPWSRLRFAQHRRILPDGPTSGSITGA